MSNKLLQIIERWQSDERLTLLSEDQVKQSIILSILRGLGWNPDNPYEVWPEYPIEDGKVDYALLTDNTPRVFIEVKRGGKSLERDCRQLEDYISKDRDVEIATLTDGATWWFYLSPHARGQELRKFDTVELDKQNKGEISQKLVDFLEKENVISEKAVQNAKNLYETLPEVEIDHSYLSDIPAYVKDIAEKYGFDLQLNQRGPYRIEAIDQRGDVIFHIETDLEELRLNSTKADFGEFNLLSPPRGNAKYAVLKVDDPRAPKALKKHINSWEYKKVT